MTVDAEPTSEVPEEGVSASAWAAAQEAQIICTMMGSAGALFLPLAVLGTPLGAVLLGGLSLFLLAGAAGLWVRSRPARVAAMVVLGAATLAILGSMTRPWSAEHRVELGFLAVLTASATGWMWWRRRELEAGPACRPWPSRLARACALVVVVMGAASWSGLRSV
jgi:hypothetical protein